MTWMASWHSRSASGPAPGGGGPTASAPTCRFAAAKAPGEQALVNLTEQPQREGKTVSETLQPVLHGSDVVRDLRDIIDRDARSSVHLVPEQVGEGGLRSLDL
jgi:hypothetical protein